MLKRFWQKYFRRHNIIDQTVGPNNDEATFLCNCGGYVVVSRMQRVPMYIDTLQIGYKMHGVVGESTCPRRPPTKLPEARVIS
jgi:hypothetical protein